MFSLIVGQTYKVMWFTILEISTHLQQITTMKAKITNLKFNQKSVIDDFILNEFWTRMLDIYFKGLIIYKNAFVASSYKL